MMLYKGCRLSGSALFVIEDFYQEDNHFPFWAGYLASVLKNHGVGVQVYCMDVYHYTNQELADYLDCCDFDLILVSCVASRFVETTVPLCKVINEHKKNAWLVLGGYGVSPIPRYALEVTGADIIVMGEAEETILDVITSKLFNGVPYLFGMKGIAFRSKYSGEIIVNERREPVKYLDSIPFPLYNVFPMDKYTSCLRLMNQEPDDKVLGIVTSRGCIGRCNFCYRMERGLRLRSIRNIIEEVKTLYNGYGVNYFLIQDECFSISKKRMKELSRALKENDLNIKFACSCRVDNFDEEMCQIMVDMGCQHFDFGLESMDQKVLDNMNKRTTVEQNINAVSLVKGYKNISIGFNFLWGNIGDTPESLKGIVDFLKEYNTYHQCRTIKPPTPYPGSDLYLYALKKGLLKNEADFFNRFRNIDLLTINFTDLTDEYFYNYLFKANKELVLNHYENISNRIIQTFDDLYNGRTTTFRGIRHYENR